MTEYVLIFLNYLRKCQDYFPIRDIVLYYDSTNDILTFSEVANAACTQVIKFSHSSRCLGKSNYDFIYLFKAY